MTRLNGTEDTDESFRYARANMAFLCTFSGMMAGGLIWMALFVAFGEAHNSSLNTIADWLSPMGIVGWVFFIALSVVCSWLTYLLLRSRLS